MRKGYGRMALDRRDCNLRYFPEDFPGPNPIRRFLKFRTFARPVDVRKARKTFATQKLGRAAFSVYFLAHTVKPCGLRAARQPTGQPKNQEVNHGKNQ